MTDPEVVRENSDSITGTIIRRAPAYTPEWTPAEGRDAGTALTGIFASIMDITITRLNRVPRLQYLSFLESLNITLIPARPAQVPLTYQMSEGCPEPVLIPAASQASAQGRDGKPIMFQTTKNLLATRSKIIAIYSVTGNGTLIDRIFNHSRSIDAHGKTSLFSGTENDDLQEHAIYLGDANVFNTGQDLKISLSVKGSNQQLLNGNVSWSYLSEAEELIGGEKKKVIVENAFNDSQIKDSVLTLSFASGDTIEEIELPDIAPKVKSRWIKGKVVKGKILGVTNIRITGIHSASADKSVYADHSFFNDIPLDITHPFYPFGAKPQLGSIWYLACEKVFSKNGYTVEIAIDLVPGSPSDTKNTPQLSWEYWNGEAWQLLDLINPIPDFCTVNKDPAGKPADFRLKIIDKNAKDSGSANNVITVAVRSFPTLKKTQVNGIENYWVRIRLIGGDYGREFTLIEADSSVKPPTFTVNGPSFNPPKINSLSIRYSKKNELQAEEISIDHIYATNNLQCVHWTKGDLQPFVALDDTSPALYFGFDKALPRGETSILVTLDEAIEYPDSYRPRILWQYLAEDGRWTDAIFLDETFGFTRSGIVGVFVPGMMADIQLFGAVSGRYWIRAVNTTGEFLAAPDSDESVTANRALTLLKMRSIKDAALASRQLNSTIMMKPMILVAGRSAEQNFISEHLLEAAAEAGSGLTGSTRPVCSSVFELMNASLIREGFRSIPPLVTGIWGNSVWAAQSQTISNEIAGSGTGTLSQEFTLLNIPVINETVWIDELTSLLETEKTVLKAENGRVEEKTDDAGNIIEFRVRWQPVDDLIGSGPKDRHYTIDRTSGTLSFGNGKNGRIPPIGQNNIRVRYTTGGGSAGNLPAASITKIHTAVAFVDKVNNVRPSYGGTDTETTDSLIERAPPSLKNRGRAVMAEDYERLALECSSQVARAKALQNFRPADGTENTESDNGFTLETGYVTIAILPQSSNKKPVPSLTLMSSVKKYLEDRCPVTVSLAIIRPSYVSANITAEIVTEKMNAVPVIEQAAREKIVSFLHPLTGNTTGLGWAFGTVPCISDFYSVLEDIDDISFVRSVTMTLMGDNDDQIVKVTETSGVVGLPAYALMYPGTCSVKVNISGGGDTR